MGANLALARQKKFGCRCRPTRRFSFHLLAYDRLVFNGLLVIYMGRVKNIKTAPTGSEPWAWPPPPPPTPWPLAAAGPPPRRLLAAQAQGGKGEGDGGALAAPPLGSVK
jgi:hypothetical protein